MSGTRTAMIDMRLDSSSVSDPDSRTKITCNVSMNQTFSLKWKTPTIKRCLQTWTSFVLVRTHQHGIGRSMAVGNARELEFSTYVSLTRGMIKKIIETAEEVLSPLSASKKQEILMGRTCIATFGNQDGSFTCILKSYPSGLITLTFEDCLREGPLTNSKLDQIRKLLHSKLKIRVEKIPIVKRGLAVPVYFTTAEERLLECDYDRVVYEADSDFQNIKILHSPTYGNSLILDDLQNLADSDISYTRGVMKYGVISYTGKDVLILGGGDGGLLHEILKEDPKFITMVENKMVIDACQIHLRGCCGDSFDKLKGDNCEVVIDDCFKKLDEYKSEGRSFDIIINDLTDIPITSTCQGESWDFIRRVINKSFDVLRPEGCYLNHALCESFLEPLKMYEDLLSSLPFKVTFERQSSYVPSFIGKWAFYEVKRVL